MADAGPRLTASLEKILPLIEHSSDLTGTMYVSAQQPVGDISRCVWQFRRADYSRLFHIALVLAPDGPVSRLASANGWEDQFQRIASEFANCFSALNRIRYAGSERGVELGDRVIVRGLLRKVPGRVSYLPGISVARAAIDFGGLFRVGIEMPGGRFTAVHVDPDSLDLRRTVRFVERDPEAVPGVPSDEELES